MGVAQHRGAAGLVEGLDADAAGAGDLGDVVDAELALGLQLGGQAVGVPAEAALHALAHLGLETADGVLDVAGQQVTVVGQAVGEGRAVVEDKLVGVAVVVVGGTEVNRLLEGAVLLPVGQDLLLHLREGGRGGHAGPVAVQGVGGRVEGLAGVGGGLGVSHGVPRVVLVNNRVSRGRRRTSLVPWQAEGGRYRGTTSLAAHEARPLLGRLYGPHPPGSSEADGGACATSSARSSGRLAGDTRRP